MKLNYKRTFFIGLAFLSICSFWQLYDSIIPLILRNTFAVDHTWSGVVMALDNVFALYAALYLVRCRINQHSVLDAVRHIFFWYGRSRNFMLPIPVADNLRRPTLFFVSLMIALLFMSTYRSPAVALMPDLTPKPLRSKANAVIKPHGGDWQRDFIAVDFLPCAVRGKTGLFPDLCRCSWFNVPFCRCSLFNDP